MGDLYKQQRDILLPHVKQNFPNSVIEQDDFFSSLVSNYKEKTVFTVGTPTTTPDEITLGLIDNIEIVEAVRTL